MRRSPALLTRGAAVTGALLLTTALAGCGKDAPKADPSASPSASSTVDQLIPSGGPSTPSAPDATGPELTGTGYTLNLPSGWSDITADAKGSEPKIDAAGRSDQRGKDYTANLNILTTKSTVQDKPSSDQLNTLAAQAKQEIVSVAPKVTTLELTDVDGVPAVHQEGDATYGKTPFYLVQFCAVRDGRNYIVTFSFPTGVGEKDRAKVIDPVLASFSFS